MPTLYLIDAHAYLHRAFHALPALTTSRGEPVNAVYGFIRMLQKILRQHNPDYLAVCFDAAGPTFRHAAFAGYKATRREADPSLVSQFPLAREAVAAMRLAHYELQGFEADDVIAHLARQGEAKGWQVVVVSGDKDALQLVSAKVSVLSEPKDILFDREKVLERWGVAPEQIPDVLALMGDASDNVPGVAGIGEKTAVKLIAEHRTLDRLLEAAPRIKGKIGSVLLEQADAARQSRSLVSLDRPVPIEVDWDLCRLGPPDPERLVPFLQRMEFQGLIRDLLPAAAPDVSSREYAVLWRERDLAAWLATASALRRLCVDVETTGLDARRCGIVGIALAAKPGEAAYIPLAHPDAQPACLTLAQVRAHLQPVFANEAVRLYGHNLKFDLAVLRRHGFAINRVAVDTMVASYVLHPSRNSHGLKELALEVLHEPMTSIEQVIGRGRKQITMDRAPLSMVAPYACADADLTLRLADHLEPMLESQGLARLFYELEMPLIPVLEDMEAAGVRLDRAYLENLGEELKARLGVLEKSIHESAGEPFNINSPKQLGAVLFEKLKLPVVRRTKTGYSTDEEVLRALSPRHPLVKQLLEFRQVQKLHATYAVGLLAALDPIDDRVHTTFNQTVTATGRLSSSDPNLQNIPIRTEPGRMVRRAFVPAPGMRLLSADYSQIDLRMLAHISGDPALKRAFLDGEDVHAATASDIYAVPLSAVTPDMRRVAKSINFGIVYGMSPYGLAEQLGVSPEEAKAHIDRYFERYAGVKAWIERVIEQARREGCVRTLLGRVRHLPDMGSPNVAVRSFAERTAVNTPIQGTSADIIKVAMLELANARRAGRWDGAMLLQVHDELVFEIPEESFASSARTIRSLMESALSLDVPVVVDLKTGPNWADVRAWQEDPRHGL